jgi:hypothetical protein
MSDNVFYNNIKCIITDEGKRLFAQQSNGPKMAKIGAVLFSDNHKVIQTAYAKDEDLKVLERLTFEHMRKYTTLIYKDVRYDLYGDIFTPTSIEAYDNAFNNFNNVLPIQIAYGNDELVDDESVTYDKYMSYDMILQINSLNINAATTMNFDGFILLGLTNKSIEQEYQHDLLKPQTFSTIAIVYFPNIDEKIQIVSGQPKEIAMNVEIHINMKDPIWLNDLIYYDVNKSELPNPMRFINGLHMVNDGLHDRG